MFELIFDVIEKPEKDIAKNQNLFISINSVPHVNCDCIYCNFPKEQILPFKWHRRSELWIDQAKITKITHATLTKLTKILNKYHNINIPERGWSLILWPWLYTLNVAIYDIESKINDNKSYLANKDILIKSPSYLELIPKNYDDFTGIIKNYKFYKVILAYIYPDILKNSTVKVDLQNKTLENKFSNKFFPGILPKLLIRIYSLLIKKNKIVFFSSYIPWPKRLTYYFKFKSFPMFNNFVNFDMVKDNENDILFRDINNKFIDNYLSLAIKLIPKSYLENFKGYSIFSSTIFPQSPSYILTGTGHFANDLFKIWAAQKLHKCKLIILQHGGHYGLGKVSNCQSWEYQIGDYFLSWGWVNFKYPKVKPYKKFIKPIKKNLYSKNKVLYVIGSGNDKYVTSTMSMPLGEQYLDYINSLKEFIQSLDKNILSNTIIRPYPSATNWEQEKIYFLNFKNIKIEDVSCDIRKGIANAHLVICTWNSTNFIDLLYSNIPTVCFWKQSVFEIEKSAQPLMDELYSANILHKNEKSASLFTNQNWENINLWWGSNKTQKAIKSFTTEYARAKNSGSLKGLEFLN